MATTTGSSPRDPGHRNGSPHRQVSNNSHPYWRTYTFVDVFVHNLPLNVTTLDLYKNFIQYGEIAIITIKNAGGGTWKNQADIRFK
jgi:RNA recognition motif-containing protein